MITFKNKGDFTATIDYLKKTTNVLKKINPLIPIMDDCISQLKSATPKDTGLTSESWKYDIKYERKNIIITVSNTNISNGVNVAFLLDAGHITSNGTWIEGGDYIEPILRDTYNKILNNICKELKRI